MIEEQVRAVVAGFWVVGIVAVAAWATCVVSWGLGEMGLRRPRALRFVAYVAATLLGLWGVGKLAIAMGVVVQ